MGCEVCYVDLPNSVSGFAQVIEDKPHIVLNRAESCENLLYTLSHELGHYVLHLDSSRDADRLELAGSDNAEVEAHMFAVLWVMFLAKGKQRCDVLNKNPEARMVLTMSVLASVMIILTGLFLSLCSRFSTQTK